MEHAGHAGTDVAFGTGRACGTDRTGKTDGTDGNDGTDWRDAHMGHTEHCFSRSPTNAGASSWTPVFVISLHTSASFRFGNVIRCSDVSFDSHLAPRVIRIRGAGCECRCRYRYVLLWGAACWFCVVVLHSGSSLWFCVAVLRSGSIVWFCVMVIGCGSALWFYIVVVL